MLECFLLLRQAGAKWFALFAVPVHKLRYR